MPCVERKSLVPVLASSIATMIAGTERVAERVALAAARLRGTQNAPNERQAVAGRERGVAKDRLEIPGLQHPRYQNVVRSGQVRLLEVDGRVHLAPNSTAARGPLAGPAFRRSSQPE